MITLKQILEQSDTAWNNSLGAIDGELENVSPTQPAAAPAPTEFKKDKKLTVEEKRNLLELVGKFKEFRSPLKLANDFRTVAENIVYISEMTEKYGLTETSEWFEGVSLSRDMKELKRNANEIQKIANDIYPKIKLAESLYEDVGLKLQRYFDI
jgi:hypothetical protein